MIITIDGPAASGKSTTARMLARRLGLEYVDTGAMYRAATWRAMKLAAEGEIDLDDPDQVARATAEAEIRYVSVAGGKRIVCDGEDVTREIRTPEVTENIWRVADEPKARRALIQQQRRLAEGRDIVAEGRDQGTEVFPGAELKFYLDASAAVRAGRRCKEMQEAGLPVSEDETRRQIQTRDRQDSTRPMGALRRADDMIVIDNSALTPEQTVARILEAIAQRRPEVLER